MHISRLGLVNFRNFSNAQFKFNAGVNTVIGENGAGKTNVFRAIRLLLDRDMLSAAYRLDEGDFHRGLQSWRGHWIVISMEFEKISDDEAIQALFIHGAARVDEQPIDTATYNLIFRPRKPIRQQLAGLTDGDRDGLNAILDEMSVDDYETVFTGRSTADFNDTDFYKEVVGDFENVVFSSEIEFPELGSQLPKQLSVAREVSFSYIKALRDVVQDFQSNRANPLRALLRIKSGDVDTDSFEAITEKVSELNKSIEEWPDVKEISADIKATIKEAVGEAYSPSSLSIRSNLPNGADRLFQSLKLYIGEDGREHEGEIGELSLGGANLIYLTLKLLEFSYLKERQAVANFLLVEEPEAHIHTHIQKALFDRLDFDDTQIIYSTHSTQISEVSNVESMNIIGRDDGECQAFQPAAGLSRVQTRNVQRYLDAVRSNLLFAKSVILVEGDAEEILIPLLVKKVTGVSLDELGISLVNIRSTGFENVALLFHDERIRKRCSIVTDLDQSILATPGPTDSPPVAAAKARAHRSQEAGELRKDRLRVFERGNDWVQSHYASHTFEVDLLAAGNKALAVKVLKDVYSAESTLQKAKAELLSNNVAEYGSRVLKMAKQSGKGWFAIQLAGRVDHHVTIPEYILRALKFAHPVISNETWFNILRYRLEIIKRENSSDLETCRQYGKKLSKYRRGDLTLNEIKSETSNVFPHDAVTRLLDLY